MKKGLCIFFVLFFSAGTIFSQSDFREGYILNLSNDTIQGFINNKGNLKNLKNCRFKASLDADAVNYSPQEINAFRIYSAGYYVSMEIGVNDEKEIVFIEQLVEGIVDIYYYSKINDQYYLIRTADGELYELKNSLIETTGDDGTIYSKKQKEYINMLRYLLKDSPSTVKKVNQLQFESNAFINIAQDYHNDVCDDYECIVYTKEKMSASLNFGLHIGYSISSITVFDNEYTKNLNKDYSSSQDIVYGLFLNYMDPNISERFSLQLDLLFQKGTYEADESSMKISYMKIPFSIKYTYPKKRLMPSVWFGMSYNKWLDFEDHNIVPEHLSGEAIQKDKHQFGVYAGIELAYKLSEKINCFVQAKYEWYKGNHTNTWSVPALTVGDYLSSKTSFISFSAGFQF